MTATPQDIQAALKPCPFCGELPSVTSGYSQQGATIECIQAKCPINAGKYFQAESGPNSSLLIDKARDTAITAWNTRPQSHAPEASTVDVEELKQLARDFMLEKCGAYKDLPIGLMRETAADLVDELLRRGFRQGGGND